MLLIVINCDYCGKEFRCSPKRFNTSKTHCCSKECQSKLRMGNYIKQEGYLNTTCHICGKKFHLKNYHLERYKTHCCSPECTKEARRLRMTGENNHQYGLKGELNASWIKDEKITNYGYKKIRSLDHPFKDCDGFVFEHRLIAEKYLLNDENSIEINGKRYLKKEYSVHHINENRLDNRVENLMVLTNGEHTSLHIKKRETERDETTGRFIAS